MKAHLNVLMVLIIGFTLNQNTMADEEQEASKNPDISITLQPIVVKEVQTVKEIQTEEEKIFNSIMKDFAKKKIYPKNFNIDNYVKRPLYEAPTGEVKECIDDLKISMSALVTALVDMTQSMKCEVSIPKGKYVERFATYGSEKNARVLLLKLACEKLRSAEEVKKLPIHCEKHVPIKPYREVEK